MIIVFHNNIMKLKGYRNVYVWCILKLMKMMINNLDRSCWMTPAGMSRTQGQYHSFILYHSWWDRKVKILECWDWWNLFQQLQSLVQGYVLISVALFHKVFNFSLLGNFVHGKSTTLIMAPVWNTWEELCYSYNQTNIEAQVCCPARLDNVSCLWLSYL